MVTTGLQTALQETQATALAGGLSEASLPPRATMDEIIARLWRLPRDIVSEGYDAALHALATQLPMRIHEYPSGTECWTWIVPEKWACHEAWLETLGGRRLFSYADHPLHVVSYSLPFEGVVSRDELFRHLHVHPRVQDAIPFVFKYYERDWGLCCTQRLKESLRDDRYRVVVRTSFAGGTLKVGEVVAPGQSSESVVVCAHLCHPAMANDDLTGVVVGMKMMENILGRMQRRYTYRFLIVPETIGSVAWLSHNENLIPRIRGGLFLEMLGRDTPHALQLSFDGVTEIDRCFTLALRSHEPRGWTGPFRQVIGNDERQFNAPGVRIPMLSLSRVLPRSHQDCPYVEYHSSQDTPERIPPGSLEKSLALALRCIDTFEHNWVPQNLFKGELFCSRFGLHIDPYSDPDGNRTLLSLLDWVDGTQSIADIAARCGVTFERAKATLDRLVNMGLVKYCGSLPPIENRVGSAASNPTVSRRDFSDTP